MGTFVLISFRCVRQEYDRFVGELMAFVIRINGQLCTVYTPSFFHYNPCLVVSACGFPLWSLAYNRANYAEPNNSSPLNTDAANLWDSPEGALTAFYRIDTFD